VEGSLSQHSISMFPIFMGQQGRWGEGARFAAPSTFSASGGRTLSRRSLKAAHELHDVVHAPFTSKSNQPKHNCSRGSFDTLFFLARQKI